MFGVIPHPGFARSLRAGTALGLVASCLAALPAAAQQPTELPAISVEGQSTGSDYQSDTPPSLPKYTEPLRDTPQSITSVPRQMMDDKGVTSLTDAIRAVPGVSMSAGEGGSQGDSLTIRGFSARNDIFLDGMRDFGSYYRDSFNFDQVDVLKGPSSVMFGRGSTGGVINQTSKTAKLENENYGGVSLGTNGLVRTTADMNQQITNTSAFRLNLMVEDTGVAERKEAENARFGIAPTMSFGIGTETRTTFSYFHQTENDKPDYGLPLLRGGPAPVDRDNFYGFSDHDYLHTTADVLTGKVEHDINDQLTVRDQVRAAYYTRNVRITEPQIPGTVTSATPLNQINVTRNQLSSESIETFVQNQTDLTAKFETSGVKHTVVSGIDFGRETSDPLRRTYTGVTPASLLNPNPSDPFTGGNTVSSNTRASIDSVGVYAVDTMKFSPQWEFLGGLRFDYLNSDSIQVQPSKLEVSRTDSLPSYRGALVYKPVEPGSIYVSYGTSFNPSAESLSLSSGTANVEPEKNETYEVGTKWDVFNEKLTLRSAVYRLNKTNARVPDPTNTALMTLGGSQRVDGVEFEAAGKLTDKWQMYGGYNHMEGEVTKTTGVGNTPHLGAKLQNTPRDTITVWSTYDVLTDWQLGGGVNFVAERVARNTSPQSTVPSYYTLDAMAKYKINADVNVQLNIYNLADRYYIDEVHPAHVVPGAGRTAILSTSFEF